MDDIVDTAGTLTKAAQARELRRAARCGVLHAPGALRQRCAAGRMTGTRRSGVGGHDSA